MNDTLDSQLTQNAKESERRLAFLKHLQMVTNRIHATSDIDELMLELSEDVCGLFNAERLTIYAVGEDKASIVSKVKTGLSTQKNLRLPISAQSIAGHVALSRSVLNIHDVYDDAELKSISPDLRFLKEVDKRTGYRTKQMLVAPVIDLPSNELLGVVQILNTKDGKPFSEVALEGVKSLSETLAIAFSQRNKPVGLIKTKYDFLVADAVVSA
ncbi:MAG: GAF domain-containing protein, partial [Rugosibacter sp.]|nr:GAF domain-containing protein [Rugosibacter sp.]